MQTWVDPPREVHVLLHAGRSRTGALRMGRIEKVMDAIEYVKEIREIIDDRDAILENVTAAVEILNGVLREDILLSISVRDSP